MRKFIFILILVTFYVLGFTDYVFAEDKNIFGLHLTQPQDIYSASSVINSSGGDWGYATIVIRTDQLDRDTWQDFFNNCRKLHIIPIVRLATIMEDKSWKTPSFSDIDNLANFLNSLNWPTTNQHIIMFNEINHASEWGGSVDIKSFTDISIYTYQKFKSLNHDFVILSGALDLAAPNKRDQYKSAANVYREIFLYNPRYFDSFDGISSHFYPKNSPKDYLWELQYLKSLGIKKDYPVYITETATPELSKYLNIWSKDNRVIAVTPFIYNYPNPPFEEFSWIDKNEKILPQYQPIIDLPKNKNTPAQKTGYKIISNRLPFILLTDNEYTGQLTLKNTGQSIWGETNFCLDPKSSPNVVLENICTSNKLIFPEQSETFNYKVKIKKESQYQDKTTITWDDLKPFEIIPIDGSGSIYSPRTTLREKFLQLIQGLFI